MNQKKSALPQWILYFLYLIFYITFLYLLIKNYKPIEPIQKGKPFWETIYSEIFSLSAILPVICSILPNIVIKKFFPHLSGKYIWIWSVLLVTLIIVYHLGIAFEWHRFVFELIGILQLIICIITSLILFSKGNIKQDKSIYDQLLLNAIGKKISNSHILSLQLFECNIKPIRNEQRFEFRIVDSVTTKQEYDVNSIDSLYLRLPIADYGQFYGSLMSYDDIIDKGDDTQKDELKTSIDSAIDALQKRLCNLKETDITKTDCCLARLLVCYKYLKNMIDSPESITLDIGEGDLGIDSALENVLFSSVRTGLLGGVLFGVSVGRRYFFRYRRGLMKTGRKYCASVIDSKTDEKGRTRQLICLVIIKETDDASVDGSVVAWIQRTESKIKDVYNKSLEKVNENKN